MITTLMDNKGGAYAIVVDNLVKDYGKFQGR